MSTTAPTTPEDTITSRYQRAKYLLQGGLQQAVPNALIFPVWIKNSNCFWYQRNTATGKEIRLVNAELASNTPAFNHSALADALAQASGEQVDANNLPVNDLNGQRSATMEMTLQPVTLTFSAFGKRWKYFEDTEQIIEVEPFPNDYLLSPDGSKAVFRRDYNLWLKDLVTFEERALTTDGEQFYQYAIPGSVFDNSAFVNLLGLQAVWSGDSQRLFTVQLDQRDVKSVAVVSHVPADGSLRPQTTFNKLAFPDDPVAESYRLVIIDIASAHVQDVNYHNVAVTYGGCGGFFDNQFGWWGSDNRHAYFVDVDRHYKYARVVQCNTDTGSTRIVFEETSSTRVELFMGVFDQANIVPLPQTNELLWYSNPSGWSHYYLYDLITGELKNTVTSGQWLVRDVVHVEHSRRELFVTTSGRSADKQRDPYYRDLVRINIDSGEITTLVSSDHEYICVSPNDVMQSLNGYCGTSCGVSPSGDFAVVTRSRADQMPASFLLDRDAENILDIETPDSSNLPENWQWPEPVTMKAADGQTDIYGVIYRPADFSPDQRYPVIDQSLIGYLYPVAAKGSFTNNMGLGGMYTEALALAELGFIVVQIDGRGSRNRDKAFMEQSYGWMNTMSQIDDHVSAIKQLAERYPFMDLDRVGICALNMGGNGVLEGMFKHPDFYKVGVCGQLYDARIMGPNNRFFCEGHSPCETQKYPEELVDNLKGKLLLMLGLQDYVPPAVTFRVVEALQRANKDFDLIVEPNWGYTSSSYQTRRAWDFLLKHLKGVQPPTEFNL